jgi:CDP-glycerol glycerophosphotransferase
LFTKNCTPEIELSIIIPIFNLEDYLSETLDSLELESLNNNVEIIMQNDASSDRTLEIALNYAKKYPRIIHVYSNEVNLGLGDTRNIAFMRARGRYVWFLDGDDLIESGLILSILESCKENYDLIYLSYMIFDQENEWIPLMEKKKNHLLKSMSLDNPLTKEDLSKVYNFNIAPWLKVVKRKLLDRGPFSPTRRTQDLYFHYLVLDKITSIKFLKKPYIYYRRREGQLTSKNHKSILKQSESFNYIVNDFLNNPNNDIAWFHFQNRILKNYRKILRNNRYSRTFRYRFRLALVFWRIPLKKRNDFIDTLGFGDTIEYRSIGFGLFSLMIRVRRLYWWLFY